MISYYNISTSKVTFVIKVDAGIVVETPPIAKKSKGRYLRHVLKYYKDVWGAKVARLENIERKK